jgi:hypothetical protein
MSYQQDPNQYQQPGISIFSILKKSTPNIVQDTGSNRAISHKDINSNSILHLLNNITLLHRPREVTNSSSKVAISSMANN